jgi:hypothetical protein
MGTGGPDVPRPDDADLRPTHCWSFLECCCACLGHGRGHLGFLSRSLCRETAESPAAAPRIGSERPIPGVGGTSEGHPVFGLVWWVDGARRRGVQPTARVPRRSVPRVGRAGSSALRAKWGAGLSLDPHPGFPVQGGPRRSAAVGGGDLGPAQHTRLPEHHPFSRPEIGLGYPRSNQRPSRTRPEPYPQGRPREKRREDERKIFQSPCESRSLWHFLSGSGTSRFVLSPVNRVTGISTPFP